MKKTIAIVKELDKDETRVVATPKTITEMIRNRFDVLVESGISDTEFREAGAKIVSDVETIYKKADIILSINPPKMHPVTHRHQIDMLKDSAGWISLFSPASELDTVKKSIRKKITLFSLNLIPRISRAQKMDVLSSQSNLAGYKAVIMAAFELKKAFPLMMTAAGTIRPAKIIILGAGIAGLQAIATAKRLGAIVEVSDVRPEVKEQVESLGGSFIEVPFDENASDEQGYAKQVSKEYLQRQTQELKKRIAHADAVITTALVAGKKAPVLITEEMVKSMPKGSVIVDMAAVQGGNCALTEPGRTVLKEGVTIIGNTNIPAAVSTDATQMFASNVLAFLLHIAKDDEFDMEDEIVSATIITKDGNILHDATKELIGDSR